MTVIRKVGELCAPFGRLPCGSVNSGLPSPLRFNKCGDRREPHLQPAIPHYQYLGKVPDKGSFLACRMALTSKSRASYLTLALPVGNLDGILGLVGLVHALNTPFSLRNRSRMALLQAKSI